MLRKATIAWTAGAISGLVVMVALPAAVAASKGSADDPAVPSSGSPSGSVEAMAKERQKYEVCLGEVAVLVRAVDALMQHREPCPECSRGGGGLEHVHSPASSWGAAGGELPESVRVEWDKRLGFLSRAVLELGKAREAFFLAAAKAGIAAPPGTEAEKSRMQLTELAVSRFLRVLQRREKDEYLGSLAEVRVRIMPPSESSVTPPRPPPPPTTAPPAPVTPAPGDPSGAPPAAPTSPPANPPAGGAPSTPKAPKAPTPEEIARKQAALAKAVREHADAIGRLRPAMDRFDELINHRRNCPACGGGNNSRDHDHAVHRTWRKTGGPLPDSVKLASTRVQRDIGAAISAAMNATKAADRIAKELGALVPPDVMAAVQRMRGLREPMENYDRTLDRNQHSTYDATLSALRAALGGSR